MLTVATVLRSGGIYDALWVKRLAAGVARHLPIEHRFVCLSDVDVPCERVPLTESWPGWWSKIELFRLDGPVLALDLDTAVVGDLSDIARVAMQASFVALRDFYRLGDGLGSGVLGWNDTDVSVACCYDMFTFDPAGWQAKLGSRGDQGFIEEVAHRPGIVRWQDAVPGQIVSYKVHCRGGIPADARLVCLHGYPKFGDMPANDTVRMAWERAA